MPRVQPPMGATDADGGAPGEARRAPFADLYRAHVQQVARWLRRMGVARDDLDDAVHDVFLVAFRRLDGFEPERASFSTWLYGIATRIASDRRRRTRWRQVADVALGALGLKSRSQQFEPAVDPLAPAEIEARERKARLHRLLGELSDKHRTTLMLYELEGLSCDQIAAITGTTVNNVWVRIHRARQELQQRWDAEARRAGEGDS